MKKYKNRIISCIVVALIVVFVYWWGGNAPGLRGWKTETTDKIETTAEIQSKENAKPISTQTPQTDKQPENTPLTLTEVKVSEIPEKKANETVTIQSNPVKFEEKNVAIEEKITDSVAVNEVQSTKTKDREYSEKSGMQIDEATGKDKYLTDPVPVGKPVPVEPENAIFSDKQLTCTLSVRCDSIFENIAWLDPEKTEIVPKDGVIYAEQTVMFYEGESVFNLLTREMKRSKIHMEFVNTPIYNSAYIEGINNIYEFDCGELSGWMYKVNDWFPNYGCSRYQLKEGDRVEWVYTCNMGIDIGGYNATFGRKGAKNE